MRLSTLFATIVGSVLAGDQAVVGFMAPASFGKKSWKIYKSSSSSSSSICKAVRLEEPPTITTAAAAATTTTTSSDHNRNTLLTVPCESVEDLIARYEDFNDNGNDDVSVMVDDEKRTLPIVESLIFAHVALASSLVEDASAIEIPTKIVESTGSFDPAKFNPVCGVSDTFYRFLQSTAETVVGSNSFEEYGPLIAGGLLRVRLELCVVESFFTEAVGPFIQQNGLSWILPLHETVETFVAGTLFALATTFILVGSTKLLTVIITYLDFFIGAPMRTIGGFFFDRARGKPVTLDIGLGPLKTRVIGPSDAEVDEKFDNDYSVDMQDKGFADVVVLFTSGSVKAAGQSVGILREFLDAIDLFVGKSLILWVTAYIIVKFVHFKIFPDFP